MLSLKLFWKSIQSNRYYSHGWIFHISLALLKYCSGWSVHGSKKRSIKDVWMKNFILTSKLINHIPLNLARKDLIKLRIFLSSPVLFKKWNNLYWISFFKLFPISLLEDICNIPNVFTQGACQKKTIKFLSKRSGRFMKTEN